MAPLPTAPAHGRRPGRHVRRGPPAREPDAGPDGRVRRPAGAAAVAHRGAPARRPDGAARGARRRLPRRARPARGGPARQRQLVRGDRQPADPDQEPGDAAAPDRSDRPDWRSPTRAPTPRPSCAPGCCSTARTATPACAWPRTRSRRIGLVPARAGGRPTPPALAGARPADAPRARPAPARPRARPAGRDRAAARAAARGHGPDDHHHRARRDHPGGPARRPDGRPPGPARRASATGSSSRSRSWPCSSS